MYRLAFVCASLLDFAFELVGDVIVEAKELGLIARREFGGDPVEAAFAGAEEAWTGVVFWARAEGWFGGVNGGFHLDWSLSTSSIRCPSQRMIGTAIELPNARYLGPSFAGLPQ